MQYQDSSYKLQAQRQRSRALATNFDLETGLRKQNVDEDVRLQRQLGQLDIVIQTAGGGKIIIPGVNLTPVDIYAIEPESGFNFRFSCTSGSLQNLTTSFSGTNFTYTAATTETGYATFIYSNGSGTLIGNPEYTNVSAGTRYTMTNVPSGVSTIGVIFLCATSPALNVTVNTIGSTSFPAVSGTVSGTNIPHTVTNGTRSTLSMTAFSSTNSQHTPFVYTGNSTTFAPGFPNLFSTTLTVLDPDPTSYANPDNELSTLFYQAEDPANPSAFISLPFSVECSAAGNGYISFVLSTTLGPLPDADQPEPIELIGPYNQLITIDPNRQDITLINYYYATDPILLSVDAFPYTSESVVWYKVYKFANNLGTGVPISILYVDRAGNSTTITVNDGTTSDNIPNMTTYSVTPAYFILTPNGGDPTFTTISDYTSGQLKYRGSVTGTGYIYFKFYDGSSSLISGSYYSISQSVTTTITPPPNTLRIDYKFYENLVDVSIDNDLSNGSTSSIEPFVPIRFQNTGTISIKITVSTSTSSTTVQSGDYYTFNPPLNYTSFNAIKQYTVSSNANGTLQTLADYTGGNFEIKGASAGSGWIVFKYTVSSVIEYVYKTITTNYTGINSISFDPATTVEFSFCSTLKTFTITNAMATGDVIINPEPYIPYSTITTNSALSSGAVDINISIIGSTNVSSTYSNPEFTKNATVTPSELISRPFIINYTITRLYTITPANGPNLLFDDTTVTTIKYKYSAAGVTGSTIYFSETSTFETISSSYATLSGPFDTLTAYYYADVQTLSVNFFSGSELPVPFNYVPYGYVENITSYKLNLKFIHDPVYPSADIIINSLDSGATTLPLAINIYRYYNNYNTTAVYLTSTGTGKTNLLNYQEGLNKNVTFIIDDTDPSSLKTSNLFLTDGMTDTLYAFILNLPLTIDLAIYNAPIEYSLPDTLTPMDIVSGDIGNNIPLDADKAYIFNNGSGQGITLTFTQLSGPIHIDPQTITIGDSYTPSNTDQLGFVSVDVTPSSATYTLTCSSVDPPPPTDLTGYTGGSFDYQASAVPNVPYITFNFVTNSGPSSDVQYDISNTPATINPPSNVIGASYIFACDYFNVDITSVPVSNIALGTGKPWSFTNSTGGDITLTIRVHPLPNNITYTHSLSAGATFYPTPADGPSNNGGPYNLAAYSAIASGPAPTLITITSVFDFSTTLTDTTSYTFDNTIINGFGTVPGIIITLTKTDNTTITSPLVTTSWTPVPGSGYTAYSVSYPEYILTADPGGSEQFVSGWTNSEHTIYYKANSLGADITQVLFIYYDGLTEITRELVPIDTTNNSVDIPDITTSISYILYDSLQQYEISSLAKTQSLSSYTPYGTFYNSLNYDVYISADNVTQQLITMGGNTTTGITDYYNNTALNTIIILQDVDTTETTISPWDASLNISLTCPEGKTGTITIYFYDAFDQLIGPPFGPNNVENGGIGLIVNTDIMSADLPPDVAYINYTTSYTDIP